MNSVRPTKRFVTVAAAALIVPLLLVWPTIVLPSLALALGAWELTRQGGPKRKDLLVVVLGFAGLSFILIVGYLASDGRFH